MILNHLRSLVRRLRRRPATSRLTVWLATAPRTPLPDSVVTLPTDTLLRARGGRIWYIDLGGTARSAQRQLVLTDLRVLEGPLATLPPVPRRLRRAARECGMVYAG